MVLALLIVSNLTLAEDIESPDLCAQEGGSVIHTPRDDVSHGESFNAVPDPLLIPLTFNLAQRYELSLPSGVETDSFLGMMEIYKDGRILYDGKDISGDIKESCDNGTFDDFLEMQILN
jgi:hypothetical protein